MLNYTARLFNFVRNLLTGLRSGCTNLHSYQQCRRASFLSHPLQYLLFVDFLIMAVPIPKKGNVKEYSNYHTIALISHANQVMLKILKARLQQYMNRELPDVQAGFRKGRGTRDQIARDQISHWIIEKAREFQKNIFHSLLQSTQSKTLA